MKNLDLMILNEKYLNQQKRPPCSDKTRQKISKGSKRPQKIVQCPHCSKSGGANGMTQWHFNKCKFKV
jgi:hypothetical protein